MGAKEARGALGPGGSMPLAGPSPLKLVIHSVLTMLNVNQKSRKRICWFHNFVFSQFFIRGMFSLHKKNKSFF